MDYAGQDPELAAAAAQYTLLWSPALLLYGWSSCLQRYLVAQGGVLCVGNKSRFESQLPCRPVSGNDGCMKGSCDFRLSRKHMHVLWWPAIPLITTASKCLSPSH